MTPCRTPGECPLRPKGSPIQFPKAVRLRGGENFIDRTIVVLYKYATFALGNTKGKGGMAMRRLVTLLLAFGLLFGVASSALANCGVNHAGTTTPAPQEPRPQS
jgi:hypothetical protein